MASILNDTPFRDRRVQERRQLRFPPLSADGMRVSWGGIWGGVLVALGLLLLMAALGVAVGVSAFDPGQSEAGNFGTGAGIWAAFSLLLALFIGGMVATRIGAIFDRTTGFFEGALVWVVSVLLAGYLASSGIGAVAGGAFKLVGGATQVVGTVMQAGNTPSVDPGVGVDQMLQRLRDQKTAVQLSAASGLAPQEVQSILNDTAERVEQNRDNPTQAASEAKQGFAQIYERAKATGAWERKAEEMKPEATAAAWISFGALLLSLIAAVAGALLGRRQAVHNAPRTAA
jgi:hypothetical protein